MQPLTRSLLAVPLALTMALLAPKAAASPFSVPTYQVRAADAPAEEGDSDPMVVEAKAEYRAGSDAYALGKYEVAVSHFERAYELSQEPALLFNLGQSYTRWYDISNDVEHLKKARRLYENYVLNVGATELDEAGQADARADAQRRIAEVDRRISEHKNPSTEPNNPSTEPVDDKGDKPVHKKAWFWLTIVGGLAVIGGVTAAVVLTTRPGGFEPELGTIGSGGGAPRQGGGLTLHF
ncbi:hypothetical protein ENSA5_10350 [Enhygromyxa salina]|uniref:Uncharacterized protein n=1 Tax=Enhygromyxa salina TaxID=215803 RepID=A0A2S9YGA2_9BACT|nr:tetratricopeptide repeat protein [Enhygromyxa salina]PRQ04145.1 hypothetical protein ENSA5_10350 [Enhygromyxa salina]